MANYNPYYTPQNTSFTDVSKNDFQNKLESLQGGAAGFSAGGPIGAAIGAGISDFKNIFEQRKNEKQLIEDLRSYRAPNVYSDTYGRPIYNLGNSLSAVQGVNVNQIGKGDKFDPIGIVGNFNSIFGGKKRRRKARRAKESALSKISEYQEDFNEANLDYSQEEAQELSRQDMLRARANRLYNIPTQYANFF